MPGRQGLTALSDEGEGLKSLHALVQEKCEALGRSTLRLRAAPEELIAEKRELQRIVRGHWRRLDACKSRR